MSVAKAGSLIDSFSQSITIQHFSAGTYVRGVWVPGGIASSFITNASVQPVSGEDLQSLPEGERTKEAIKVYTTIDVHPTDQRNGIEGDRIVSDGKTYIAIHSEAWRYDFVFYKVIAVRVKE